MKCPKCDTKNPDDSKFCKECAAPLILSDDVTITRTLQSPLASPGITIAGKYKILSELGRGGMGVVYKAKDTRLKRTVALKFLPAELTKEREAKKRFIQEAQAAAALNHPQICTIYEVDEAEDQTFISMEYIEGQSLKDKLKKGPLTIDEAKDIALQVAEGLKEAHEKGIVHRDIKPANIMLTKKGHAKITDFGLAKLSWGVDLTKTSMILGTVAYMSPEQARGEEVDHRTDLWSLGAMLYELLTNERPFQKSQEHALIFAILNDTPTPITALQPDIPSHIEQVIEKALTKKASERYQDTQELIKDLKQSSPIIFPKTEKSIIVLPFENLSPDPEQEYFCDGMTEEIISDLSKVQTLKVISRSSAMTFKGTKKKIRNIAKDVNVQYVLEGSVRKAGNKIRITAQLIEAADDIHLWAEKYGGTLDDVFDIQEKVSRSIVDTLKIKLTPGEQKKMEKQSIDDAHAYDCYLRASREIGSFREDGIDRAIKNLQNGLDIVGENAILYAGMSYAYWQYVNNGIKQVEYLEKAEELANKSLELDSECAQGHFAHGLISMLRGNQQECVRHLNRSLSINPNDFDTLYWLGLTYTACCGKSVAAKPIENKLLEIDPLNPLSHLLKGIILSFDGHFDLALEPLSRAYYMDSEVPSYQFIYAWCMAYAGRNEESISIVDKGLKSSLKDVWTQMSLMLKLAILGDAKNMSQVITPDFQNTVERDPAFLMMIAGLYSLLNEKKEALDWLENAVDRDFINYPWLAEIDPSLENIRGEPRFKKLMERVKHEWENFEV